MAGLYEQLPLRGQGLLSLSYISEIYIRRVLLGEVIDGIFKSFN